MQPALQALSQRLHVLQASLSIPILNNENFDIKPSSVPTGQIVLQNILPFLNERYPIIIKTVNENEKKK